MYPSLKHPPIEIVKISAAQRQAHCDGAGGALLFVLRRRVSDQDLEGVVAVFFFVLVDALVRIGDPTRNGAGLEQDA